MLCCAISTRTMISLDECLDVIGEFSLHHSDFERKLKCPWLPLISARKGQHL